MHNWNAIITIMNFLCHKNFEPYCIVEPLFGVFLGAWQDQDTLPCVVRPKKTGRVQTGVSILTGTTK